MRIKRIDLADDGSPEKLVSTILRIEPDLPIAVPIEALCEQLDLTIETRETDGFVGALITDEARHSGIIILRSGLSRERRRFTAAHELGHWLIPRHALDRPDGFYCSAEDMARRSSTTDDQRVRREIEANRFAALVLMPPPALRRRLGQHAEPSLEHMIALAREFDVSKEAMARSYAGYRSEAIAFVLIREGKIRRFYKHRDFPRMVVEREQLVPRGSCFYNIGHLVGVASQVVDVLPDLWIDVERGKSAPKLYEQVCLQRSNYALLMLWYEAAADTDEDDDENRTSKERWRDRRERFNQ